MKDETSDLPITAFLELKSKMYTLIKEDSCKSKRSKRQ